ncbi:toprim domain-containing protein [Bacillus sp. AR18-7]|uniref:toprim domain-containing protein n=1 Tax=Bacillus sp. AR18-7 TaxID=2217821 RepID=UPI002107B399|nr:toprim domain-containing protein [Bacillus sp. AR18-7]
MSIYAYRATKLKGWYEYREVPCDICGHTDMCMIHEDGTKIVCCRVKSEIPFGSKGACPGYLHFLNGGSVKKLDFDNIMHFDEVKKKSPRELNIVYQFMLKYCELEEVHLQHLLGPERGMSKEEIQIRQYKSFPGKPWEIAKNVANSLRKVYGEEYKEKIFGVPGFHIVQGTKNNYVSINGSRDSILIPCRDTTKQIVGFQYRMQNPPNRLTVSSVDKKFKAKLVQQPNMVQVFFQDTVIYEGSIDFNEKEFRVNDKKVGSIVLKKGSKYLWLSSAKKENGTGAGSPLPVHLSVPYQILKDWQIGEEYPIGDTVWVTEGILKADRLAQLLYDFRENPIFKLQGLNKFGTSTWGIPGVGSYNLLLPLLKEKGVKQVILAYDMDVTTNPDVKMHLLNFSKKLSQEGIQLNAAIWDIKDAKGIDELLYKKLLPTVVTIG